MGRGDAQGRHRVPEEPPPSRGHTARFHNASTGGSGTARRCLQWRTFRCWKRAGGDGRCPARTVDLLLVRREQVLRSTAACRSLRSASGEPHPVPAFCCGLSLPKSFHTTASRWGMRCRCHAKRSRRRRHAAPFIGCVRGNRLYSEFGGAASRRGPGSCARAYLSRPAAVCPRRCSKGLGPSRRRGRHGGRPSGRSRARRLWDRGLCGRRPSRAGTRRADRPSGRRRG
jgi:hypothetical protein